MKRNVIKFDRTKRNKSRPGFSKTKPKQRHSERIWRYLPSALIMLSVGLLAFWMSDSNIDWSNPPGNVVVVAAHDVRVVDGDTVEVAGEKLRLKGWDTPEKFGNEQCAREKVLGERASQYAKALFGRSREFLFVRTGTDSYGRTLSHWSLDGKEYGLQLQEAGLAKRWRFGLEMKPDWCLA